MLSLFNNYKTLKGKYWFEKLTKDWIPYIMFLIKTGSKKV